MLTKNQKIKLDIDGMSTEGNGIGHYEGIAVFVPNSAIGDRLLVHIVKVKKTYAFGKIEEIIKSSPARIESDCPVSSRCGGCCYRHISYEAELKIKQQRVYDAFKRIGHIEPPLSDIIASKNVDRYRNKAQFPIGIENSLQNSLQIGFYALNSHRIIPCKECKLQPKIFTDILNIIENWILTSNVSIYSEASKKGLLRHIYLRRGERSEEIMVCLVINGERIPNQEPLIDELSEKIANLKTVVLNVNKSDTNVIVGDSCIPLMGDGYIHDTLCGLTFRISPLSFYQVNTPQAEVLYEKAAEYAALEPSDILLDLYCGTGTIGLSMANRVKKLVGVEIIPEAIEDAKLNAAANGITNAEFICGDAKNAAQSLEKSGLAPDVVLVDPPRKGLTPELIQSIDEMSPRCIIYISCDPATLARDTIDFYRSGYKIEKSTPVDMFPRTGHVECVCLISRKEK